MKASNPITAKIFLDPIFYTENLNWEVCDGKGGLIKKYSVPIITVCLLLDPNFNTVVARGISIRSLQDSFRRKKGRDKSFGRAMKAYVNAGDFLPIISARFMEQVVFIGDEEVDRDMPLAQAREIGPCKAMYHPTLTGKEMKLVQKKIERDKLIREKNENQTHS